jgi:hypothetical protein
MLNHLKQRVNQNKEVSPFTSIALKYPDNDEEMLNSIRGLSTQSSKPTNIVPIVTKGLGNTLFETPTYIGTSNKILTNRVGNEYNTLVPPNFQDTSTFSRDNVFSANKYGNIDVVTPIVQDTDKIIPTTVIAKPRQVVHKVKQRLQPKKVVHTVSNQPTKQVVVPKQRLSAYNIMDADNGLEGQGIEW